MCRTLTKEEINELKEKQLDDMELIVGQDHCWYLYSNSIDGYYYTGLSTSKIDEYELIEIVNRNGEYYQDDALWIFGDIDI